MTDEVQAGTDIATTEAALHGKIADLQAQLATALDAKAATEKALAGAKEQTAKDVEAMKANATDFADHAERAKALVASFEHAVNTNSPMTAGMVTELKVLLTPQ